MATPPDDTQPQGSKPKKPRVPGGVTAARQQFNANVAAAKEQKKVNEEAQEAQQQAQEEEERKDQEAAAENTRRLEDQINRARSSTSSTLNEHVKDLDTDQQAIKLLSTAEQQHKQKMKHIKKELKKDTPIIMPTNTRGRGPAITSSATPTETRLVEPTAPKEHAKPTTTKVPKSTVTVIEHDQPKYEFEEVQFTPLRKDSKQTSPEVKQQQEIKGKETTAPKPLDERLEKAISDYKQKQENEEREAEELKVEESKESWEITTRIRGRRIDESSTKPEGYRPASPTKPTRRT